MYSEGFGSPVLARVHQPARPHTHFLRIVDRGPEFKLIDQEWHWDKFLILQALVFGFVGLASTWLDLRLPLWNSRSFFVTAILHVIVAEPLYYVIVVTQYLMGY
ncbi:hypothetical protein Droror1_Dr00006804 [Drosera rotundifolia]